MTPIMKIMLIYGLIFGGTFLFVAFFLAWSEIKTKVGSMLGSRKGKGLVQIIKSNGRQVEMLVPFGNPEVKYNDKTYSLEKALENPSKYVKIKWVFVPVVQFREGIPEPIALIPAEKVPFDMDYYNKVVELAYMTGATEKFNQDLKQIKNYAMLGLISAAIGTAMLLYIFPTLQPFLQGLAQAKVYASSFARKLIAWLQ